MEKVSYDAPEVQLIELSQEGVLCDSKDFGRQNYEYEVW